MIMTEAPWHANWTLVS